MSGLNQNAQSSSTETVLGTGEKREKQSGVHKIVFISRHEEPCKADYLHNAVTRRVSGGLHSIDDYIIYR